MRADKQTKKAIEIGRQQARETLRSRKLALKRRATVIRALPKAQIRAMGSARLVAATSAVSARTRGVLVAEGDSWFDYPLHDVLKELDDSHGYDVESVAHKGDPVEDMAYGPSQLDDFTRRLEKVLTRGPVKAVLLSGGGNDIAGDVFEMLLNHSRSSIRGLNAAVVDGVINQRLRSAYTTIISAVTAVCVDKIGQPLPIVVHGYAHPVPDGRGFWGGWGLLPGPWLEPGFRRKGYENLVERIALTRKLIDDFNSMIHGVASLNEFKHVHYLDLRSTLSPGADYKKYWANELHPTKRGFEAIAAKYASLLSTV